MERSLKFNLIVFGILLPIAALSIELSTHICASAFFDPIPLPLAVLFVALVPIANILAFLVLSKAVDTKLLFLAGYLNTFAYCISALYAVIFLPLMPLALIAICFYGLGFLCSAPLLSFLISFSVRKRLRALLAAQQLELFPISLCLTGLLVAFAIAGFSSNLTRACEIEIARQPQQLSKCLLLMRAFGNNETMLRACYGLEDANFIWTGFCNNLTDWSRVPLLRRDWSAASVTNDLARELFYRVTGKSFNAMPHPKLQASDRYKFLFDSGYYEYDQDFAGEAVGGVVRGLKLSSSRIDGEFDPDAAVERFVWSMKFDKKGYDSRELRAQIMLPPGAVVSGAWLMQDGERRDAVFQARHIARKGYEKEAKNGASGLLIATAGPARVLIQAPSVTSSLELGLQIDAPMKILQENKVLSILPALTERNFELACKTDLHLVEALRSKGELADLKRESDNDSLQLSNSELFSGLVSSVSPAAESFLEHARDPGKNNFRAENPLDAKSEVLQTIEKHRLPGDKPLLVVLDGSASMAECIKPICDSLQKLAFKDATLVWASDEPVVVVKHVKADSSQWNDAIARIKDSACLGGQDNAAALKVALLNCLPRTGANIVWLHGPQAVKFSSSNLLALWEPCAGKSSLYEYQAVPGPNELIRSLDLSEAVQVVSHRYGVKGDLELLFSQLDGSRDVFTAQRKFVAKGEFDKINVAAPLAQLCANDLIRAKLSDHREDAAMSDHGENAAMSDHGVNAAMAEMAEKFRIVTALSSCVVLLDQPAPAIVAADLKLLPPNPAPGMPSNSLPPPQPQPRQQSSQSLSSSRDDNLALPTPRSRASESERSSTAALYHEGTELSAEPLSAEKPAGSFLIPTKPEPPLGLLMFCVLLISFGMVWRQRVQKDKCF